MMEEYLFYLLAVVFCAWAFYRSFKAMVFHAKGD